MTAQRSLLDRLVAEELTLHHCRDIQAEIEAQARGGPALRRLFTLNCYEIEINFETREVAVIDILDAGESGRQMIPLAEFVAALDTFVSARRPRDVS
jgi:hypothetical protein